MRELYMSYRRAQIFGNNFRVPTAQGNKRSTNKKILYYFVPISACFDTKNYRYTTTGVRKRPKPVFVKNTARGKIK